MKYQGNYESIIQGAVDALPKEVSSKPVEEDWLCHFFEQCKTVNDKEMQIIWSRLLAGEITDTGSYSTRTINIVRSLDKEDAKLFSRYCSYLMEHGKGFYVRPLPEGISEYIENKLIMNLGNYILLDELGLINSDHLLGFGGKEDKITQGTLNYYDYQISIYKNETEYALSHMYPFEYLTHIGHELHRIAGAQPDYEYMDKIIECYTKEGFTVTKERNSTQCSENGSAGSEK
jgi:hypothetical protein